MSLPGDRAVKRAFFRVLASSARNRRESEKLLEEGTRRRVIHARLLGVREAAAGNSASSDGKREAAHAERVAKGAADAERDAKGAKGAKGAAHEERDWIEPGEAVEEPFTRRVSEEILAPLETHDGGWHVLDPSTASPVDFLRHLFNTVAVLMQPAVTGVLGCGGDSYAAALWEHLQEGQRGDRLSNSMDFSRMSECLQRAPSVYARHFLRQPEGSEGRTRIEEVGQWLQDVKRNRSAWAHSSVFGGHRYEELIAGTYDLLLGDRRRDSLTWILERVRDGATGLDPATEDARMPNPDAEPGIPSASAEQWYQDVRRSGDDPRTVRPALIHRRAVDAGRAIRYLEKINRSAFKLVQDSESHLSKGGMATKLKAAKSVADAGCCSIIANGRQANVLTRIMNGEDVGTIILASGL